METNKILGIDLGTTYSCTAYVDDLGKTETLRNLDGDLTTPSVVYFEDVENQKVGKEAKAMAVMEPENTVSFIKREMGKDFRRTIHGIEYSPQEISAKILMKVVGDANEALREKGVLSEDEEVKKVVITCPAYFGLAEKEATRTAGQLAGLEVLDIINEPTAAAINYGAINANEKKNVLVYDLGGGTFDVTLISVDGRNIKVVVTGGDPELGGKDWDDRMVRYFVEKWQQEMGTTEDISDDLEVMTELIKEAEEAKIRLSKSKSTKTQIQYEGEKVKLTITREEYDALTKDLLERTISLTNDCLEKAEQKGYGLDTIDEILLVGGSSRMPQVKECIEEVYNKPTKLFDPDEAVAKGAAIYAQHLDTLNVTIEAIAKSTNKTEEEVKKELASGTALSDMAEEANVALDMDDSSSAGLNMMTISNVSSRTYGVMTFKRGTDIRYITNFIFQNDELPKEATKTFTTRADNQVGVDLEIYESLGNEEKIEELETANLITTIRMDFVQSVPIATPIVVTIRLENSGLIYVDAEEQKYHSKLNATYQTKNGLDEDELASALQRSNNSTVE